MYNLHNGTLFLRTPRDQIDKVNFLCQPASYKKLKFLEKKILPFQLISIKESIYEIWITYYTPQNNLPFSNN